MEARNVDDILAELLSADDNETELQADGEHLHRCLQAEYTVEEATSTPSDDLEAVLQGLSTPLHANGHDNKSSLQQSSVPARGNSASSSVQPSSQHLDHAPPPSTFNAHAHGVQPVTPLYVARRHADHDVASLSRLQQLGNHSHAAATQHLQDAGSPVLMQFQHALVTNNADDHDTISQLSMDDFDGGALDLDGLEEALALPSADFIDADISMHGPSKATDHPTSTHAAHPTANASVPQLDQARGSIQNMPMAAAGAGHAAPLSHEQPPQPHNGPAVSMHAPGVLDNVAPGHAVPASPNVGTPGSIHAAAPSALDVVGAGTGHTLPPHELALQQAQAMEESLLAGSQGSVAIDPLTELGQLLQDARQDWNPRGRPDASGAMIGGSVALKLEELGLLVPGLAQQWRQIGRPKVVAVTGPVVAIGTSLGATLVFQLPSITATARDSSAPLIPSPAAGVPAGIGGAWAAPGAAAPNLGSSMAATATGAAGAGAAGSGAQEVPLLLVGEARNEAEAVTALGFSHVIWPADPIWLVVGHASGVLAVWDLQKRPARQVAAIAGQHGLPITHVSFFPARTTSMALSADRRGRLVVHTFTNLLLRTSVASRAILDGSIGVISSICHLTPFPIPAAAATAAAMVPGAAAPPVLSSSGAHDAGSSSGGGQAANAPLTSSSGGGGGTAGDLRVGDGMVAICTSSNCHIARFRPSGDMISLYVVPRADGARAGALPCAAWMPHGKRGAPPTSIRSQDDTSVFCALLAVAWDKLVLFYDIPLLGDHRTAAEAAAAAALERDAARRNTLMRAVSAAAAARIATGEPLTPPIVKQLASQFPLFATHVWTGEQEQEGEQQQQQQQGQQQQGSTVSADTLNEDRTILGLHWYDADALGVILQEGLAMRLLVVGMDMKLREQVECFDTPLPSSYIITPGQVPACQESVAGQGSRVVLLGASGALYCSRLMSWQERLRTLQDIGKWRMGLWYGLEFFKMHQHRRAVAAAAAAAVGADQGKAGTAADTQHAEQLQQWLLSLLLGHLAATLQAVQQQGLSVVADGTAAAQDSSTLVPRQVMIAARVATSLCLLLESQQVLFGAVFPLFQSAGLTPALLEALEPHILADRLPVPPPELVQALVEHCARTLGRPDRVERCVLHMDVLSLDLDQVLRLCEAHQLYSALIYIYNRINDFRRPVLDLLWAIVSAGSQGQARAFGYKLLVYLRCVFRSQPFPPGSAALPSRHSLTGNDSSYYITNPQQHVDELKAQVFGLLLFNDTADLSKEWRRSVPELAQRGVHDPCPALQVLLSVDPAASMSVLGEAVDGWDAVETELRAAAGKPAEELDSVMIATQVLVNALVRLVQSNWPQAAMHTAMSSVAAPAQQHPADLTAVLAFIAGLLAARRVTVEPAFALQLLKHVALTVEAAGPDITSSSSPAQGTMQDQQQWRQQQEDLFIQLVQAVGVDMSTAGTASSHLGMFSTKEAQLALQLSQRAGFMRGTAAIQHLLGNFSAATQSYLVLPAAQPVFEYINRYLAPGSLEPAAKQQLHDAVLSTMPQLVARDAAAAAALVLLHFPVHQEAILAQIQHDAALQFQFMQALLQQSWQQQQQQQEDQDALPTDGSKQGLQQQTSQLSSSASGNGSMYRFKGLKEAGVTSSTFATAAIAAAVTTLQCELLQRSSVCELYVQLLCQFEPRAVLPFLLSHHSYDVRRCIAYCQQFGVMDAEAFLHERLGDLDASLALYLKGLHRANVELVTALVDNMLHPSIAAAPQHSASEGPSDEQTFVHLEWLASLSPHIRMILPRVCGTSLAGDFAGRTAQRTTLLSLASPTSHTLTSRRLGSSTLLPHGSLHAAPPAVARRSGSGSFAVVVPEQLTSAWAALQTTIGFCHRSSKGARQRHAHDVAGQQDTSTFWFQLLRVFVDLLRVLKQLEEQQAAAGSTSADSIAAADRAAAAAVPAVHSSPQAPKTSHALSTGSQAVQVQAGKQQHSSTVSTSTLQLLQRMSPGPLRVLHHIMGVFLEEVIGCMSEHLPLAVIIAHITNCYGDSGFGEFRATLLGLFSSCAYEHNIMGTANRLITKDAYSRIHQSYALRTSPPQEVLVSPSSHSTSQPDTPAYDSRHHIRHPAAAAASLQHHSTPLQGAAPATAAAAATAATAGTSAAGPAAPGPSSSPSSTLLVSDAVQARMLSALVGSSKRRAGTSSGHGSGSSSNANGSGFPTASEVEALLGQPEWRLLLAPALPAQQLPAGDFSMLAGSSRPRLYSHIDVPSLLRQAQLLAAGRHREASGTHGAALQAASTVRAASFNIDELLSWAMTNRTGVQH